MALTKLTADVENISKLDNYPPDDAGMTPAKLKAKFDQAGIDIKAFLNNTLIPEVDAQLVTNQANADAAIQSAAQATAAAIIAANAESVATSKAVEATDALEGITAMLDDVAAAINAIVG